MEVSLQMPDMEVSLQMPDNLYIGQSLYKGIPVPVPAPVPVLPLWDPRRPGPGKWNFSESMRNGS